MAACMACGKDIGSRGYRPRSVGFTAPIIERAGSILRAGGAPAPLVCMSCALDKEHKARVRLVVSSTAVVVLAGGLWVAFATGTVARVRNAMGPAPVAEAAASPQPVAECAPDQASSAAVAGDSDGDRGGPAAGGRGGDTAAGSAGGQGGGQAGKQVAGTRGANGQAGGAGASTAAAVSCRVRDWRSALRAQTQF